MQLYMDTEEAGTHASSDGMYVGENHKSPQVALMNISGEWSHSMMALQHAQCLCEMQA